LWGPPPSQQLASEQGQREDVCNKVRYSEVRDVINFSRWQIRMNAILTQSGLKKALLEREKKPQDMKEKNIAGVE